MAKNKVYKTIVSAVQTGLLAEPFGMQEFRKACPGFGDGTYRSFLSKHCKGNGKETELFERVSSGRYIILRPIKYI